MTKLMTAASAAVLALTLGVSTPTLAQTPGPDASGMVTPSHSMKRASKVIGGPVYNAKGEEIGTIDDLLVDPNGGPPMVVLSVGKYIGEGDKLVAVPLSSVQFDHSKMMMPQATQLSLEMMHEFVWQNFNSEGAG